jgi:hypothetical protein
MNLKSAISVIANVGSRLDRARNGSSLAQVKSDIDLVTDDLSELQSFLKQLEKEEKNGTTKVKNNI